MTFSIPPKSIRRANNIHYNLENGSVFTTDHFIILKDLVNFYLKTNTLNYIFILDQSHSFNKYLLNTYYVQGTGSTGEIHKQVSIFNILQWKVIQDLFPGFQRQFTIETVTKAFGNLNDNTSL